MHTVIRNHHRILLVAFALIFGFTLTVPRQEQIVAAQAESCVAFSAEQLLSTANTNHNPPGSASVQGAGFMMADGYTSLRISADNGLLPNETYTVTATIDGSFPNPFGSKLHIWVHDNPGDSAAIAHLPISGATYTAGLLEIPFTTDNNESGAVELSMWKDPDVSVTLTGLQIEGTCNTEIPVVADATASTTLGELPLEVTFNPSASTGNITEYRWDFGDGNTVTHTQPDSVTHTYTTAGDFVASLTVFDGTNSDRHEITISAGQTVVGCSAFDADELFGAANPNHNPPGSVLQTANGITLSDGFVNASVSRIGVLLPSTDYIVKAELSGSFPNQFGNNFHMWLTDNVGDNNAISHVALNGASFADGTLELPFTTEATETGDLQISFWKDPNIDLTVENLRIEGACGEQLIAAMSMTTPEAGAPLTITFDPAESTGSIIDYGWNMGDGTTLSNADATPVTHTFAESGTYIVGLTVDDGTRTDLYEMSVTVDSGGSQVVSGYETCAIFGVDELMDSVNVSHNPPGVVEAITDGFQLTAGYADMKVKRVGILLPDTEYVLKATLNGTYPNLFGANFHLRVHETIGESGAVAHAQLNGNDFVAGVLELPFVTDSAEDGHVEISLWKDADIEMSLSNLRIEGVECATELIDSPNLVPPEAQFTTTGNAGNANFFVGFDATASTDLDGTIVSYFWEFGNGMTSTDPTPLHIYRQDGLYTVSLTVTDNDGLRNTLRMTDMIQVGDVIVPGSTQIEIANISGVSGYTVGIFGEAFGETAGSVTILGASAEILDWTDTFVRVVVPVVADGSDADGLVLTTVDGESATSEFTVYTIDPQFLTTSETTFENVSNGKSVSVSGARLDLSQCTNDLTGASITPETYLSNYVCRYDVAAKFAADAALNTESVIEIDFGSALTDGTYLFQFFSRADWSQAVPGVCPSTGYPMAYVVESSADGSNWSATTISISDNLRGNRSHYLDLNGNVRYLRMVVTDSVADCRDDIPGKDFEMKEVRLFQVNSTVIADATTPSVEVKPGVVAQDEIGIVGKSAEANAETPVTSIAIEANQSTASSQATNNTPAAGTASSMAIYGDSITAGAFNFLNGHRNLNAIIEGNTYSNMPFAPLGYSGRKASQLAEDFEDPNELIDAIEGDAIAGTARYFGLALGSNDINLNGINDPAYVNPDSQFNQFDEAMAIDGVQWLIDRGRAPILARIPDTDESTFGYGFLEAKRKVLNDIDTIAATYRLIPGPDFYTDFRLNLENDNGSWFSGDGTHLANEGPQVWVQMWADSVLEICTYNADLDFCPTP